MKVIELAYKGNWTSGLSK